MSRCIMSSYGKAVRVMAAVIEKGRTKDAIEVAVSCIDELAKHKYVIRVTRGSAEMLRRFHAHCRHLGEETGKGYRYYYTAAVEHAMKMQAWPVKIIPRMVKLDTGQVVDVDVPVPESSTRATTAQLMEAYNVITDEAIRAGVRLPEHPI